MFDFLKSDGLNINHEHKTWTPDDRIRYEKEMILFRLKIAGVGLLAAALLFATVFLII